MKYHRTCVFLLFLIRNVKSVCKISLTSGVITPYSEGPLIYKYKSDGTPVFHYPSAFDGKCLFQSEDQKIDISCADWRWVPSVRFYLKDGNQSRLIDTNSRHVYLLHDSSDDKIVRVHGGPSPFPIVSGNTITCTTTPASRMYFLNATEGSSINGYVVGYRLNDIDLLKVYDQVFRDEEWIVTRYRISPAIQNRLPDLMANQVWLNEVWIRGLFYLKKDVNFTELYSKEYQIAEIQRHFNDIELTEKYMSGNNSLVMGQLLFTEDTFYYNQILSTHYYENTVPIWKSVYEGNWRTIGIVIRKMAAETDRELDVYVSAWPSYHVSWTDGLTLGNTTKSPDIVPVAWILVKAAVDVNNVARGVVFHTFNDPHLHRKIAADRLKDYCATTTDCNELHRDFEDIFKGYTFCCTPQHSYIFKRKFGF